MKLKTAKRVLSRNKWIIARSMVESRKIRPPSLKKRVNEAIKVLEKSK